MASIMKIEPKNDSKVTDVVLLTLLLPKSWAKWCCQTLSECRGGASYGCSMMREQLRSEISHDELNSLHCSNIDSVVGVSCLRWWTLGLMVEVVLWFWGSVARVVVLWRRPAMEESGKGCYCWVVTGGYGCYGWNEVVRMKRWWWLMVVLLL